MIHLLCTKLYRTYVFLRYGHLEVARYLVGQGANVSTKSIGGFQPVHVAAQYGHFDLLKFLERYSVLS